jgi:hypothetical protein
MRSMLLGLLIIIGVLYVISLFVNRKDDNRIDKELVIESNSSQSYVFVLTHLLDKKLTNDAYFYVGNMNVWELDFRNGNKIQYNILSMNSENLMCGISAKDNFGDYWDICITKIAGDKTEIDFTFNEKRLTYKGYLLRDN